MSLTTKLIAIGVLLLALLAGVWKLWHAADRAGYERSQAEYQAAAELQRETNRGRARQAEEKQAAQEATRERFITRTTKEVGDASKSLASVPLPDDARRLLNNAAACAREDRPASCGAGDGVPGSR